MIDPKEFYDGLLARDLDYFAGVPDSLLKNLCACITQYADPARHTITANEGNAVAAAAGYHMATGRYGVVYMQNSGIGNAVNPLLSLADEQVYGIPMLLIIGWRGEPGVKDEPQHKKQGLLTLPLLDTMGIAYEVLTDDWAGALCRCVDKMKAESKPVALVIRKGAFADYAVPKQPNPYTLPREQALEIMLGLLPTDAMVVSTTGKTSRELFELREARGEDHAHDFLTVGSMGHTASIACGMAAGCERPVYCVDGDGSFLMHMGGFAVIGSHTPPNFRYILINNGAHESVGGQPTDAFRVDIPAILTACGFSAVYTAETAEEIAAGMAALETTTGGALMILTRTGSREDLGRPTTTPVENKTALMAELAKEIKK